MSTSLTNSLQSFVVSEPLPFRCAFCTPWTTAALAADLTSGARGYSHGDEPSWKGKEYRVQERYRFKGQAWWVRGQAPLQLEHARNDTRRDVRTRSVTERTARTEEIARVDEGSKHFLGRDKSTYRRARCDVAAVLVPSSSCLCLVARRSAGQPRADRRSYRYHENATMLVQQVGVPNSAEITYCARNCGNCEALVHGERIHYAQHGM